MSNYVPPVGPSNARIAFVGEAPGHDEDREGRPFVGASGRLLTEMLSHAGINRNDCWITNVVKYRPPNNNFSYFYEDGESRRRPTVQLQAAIDELKQELQRVRPNVICCLGGEPLKALTGRIGITKWRGSILSSSVGKVVATFHPAAVLRTYTDKPIVNLDLRRVKAEATSPTIVLPRHQFILNPSKDDVLAYLARIRPGDRLAFDIETLADQPDDPVRRSFFVRCLGLATCATEAICIPFMSLPGQYHGGTVIPTESSSGCFNNHYTEDDEYAILSALDRVFRDERVRKVAQNFPFDTVRLEKQFGIRVRGLELDTMLGWHTCYSELPKGLDFLCSILTRVPYYSDHDNSVDLDEWKYNCYDACVTWEITDPIIKELKEAGLWEPYKYHVEPTLIAATRTENRGMRIDEGLRAKMTTDTEIEVEALRDRLASIVGNPDFNPKSTQQCQDYFYGILGLPKQYSLKRKPDGSRPITFDKNARDQLAKKFPQHAELLGLVDEFTSKKTLLTGFLRRPVRPDGRMYTHYNVAGTVTRRIAASDPGDEPGTNTTNIPIRPQPVVVGGKVEFRPSKFRDLFIADEGCSLIKADLKAAEYMTVMWTAPVPRVIEKFTTDPSFSPHRWIASLMYNKPESEITNKSIEYMNGKNGNYGGGYGMMPPKAAIVWKVPEQEAEFIMLKYHQLMPEIQALYWPKIAKMITTSRTLWYPSGLRLMLFDRIEPGGNLRQAIFRDGYSYWAQGHIADVINRAWHLVDASFDESECRVIHQNHDELLFNCQNEFLGKYIPLVQSFMEYEVQFPDVSIPLKIPAEVTYGPTWLQQKAWKEVA